jgi:CMP-N,N'-diacetyllegionaminic acid synthase
MVTIKTGETWAVIPARGGSRGIPRKNLLPVAGLPLIAYSIRHGLRCPLIHRVIVSTDDPEIAEVARAHGAEVPFLRPSEFATDGATDLMVFRHLLDWARETADLLPEALVHLRPTGPVRDVTHVNAAVRQFLDTPEADSLRSVHVVLETPYKMWRLENGRLAPLLSLPGVPEAHSMPRQQLPPVYLQNGYVDVIRARTILEMDSMCGQFVLPFVTEGPVPDLDIPSQIPAVEAAVLSHYHPGGPSP